MSVPAAQPAHGARGIEVVEDAAHAAGARYAEKRVGRHSRAVAFSFHDASSMTTGEGGMLTTNDSRLAAKMRRLSMHGLRRNGPETDSCRSEIHEAGYPYNMTDIQAALGIHQLRRLEDFIERRREIALTYHAAFADLRELRLPEEKPGREHVYHLYPVRLDQNRCRIGRDAFISQLNKAQIGASVPYVPLHHHPWYRSRFGYRESSFPVAETIYRELVFLPLYPKMSDGDVNDVIDAVRAILLGSRSRQSPGDYAAAS